MPIFRQDIIDMIHSLRSFPILEGARGGEILDKDSLIETVFRIAHIMEIFPEIREIDINPLLVCQKGEGSIIMDSRVVLTT